MGRDRRVWVAGAALAAVALLAVDVAVHGSVAGRCRLVDGHCDLAQGYLFARPLEPADASLLLLATVARAGA